MTTSTTPAPGGGATASARPPGRRASSVTAHGPSLWFAAPALIVFIAFALIPLIGVFALSFVNWNGIGAISWAGLANWQHVLTDELTYNALMVTAKVMFFSYIIQTPIAILLGTFTAGGQRYRAFLAVLYFVPLLLSSAAIAIAFKALLDPNFGLGAGVGIEALSQDWLGNPDLVLFVVVFVIAWQFIPFHTLIYQGGVRQIPTSHVRGRADRRSGPGPAVLLHHPAAAEVHHHHLLHADGRRVADLLRPRLRPDRRRTRLQPPASCRCTCT